MNKRAKQRLIGVTAIIVLVIAAILYGVSSGVGASAVKSTVAGVTGDASLVGKQIQVSGPVVEGSWTPGANPLVFDIRDQDVADGPRLTVTWSKAVPSAFGDGTVAIVKGIVQEDGTLLADSLITQCPSKYESSTGALSVGKALEARADVGGNPIKVYGTVVAGSIKPAGGGDRFTVGDSSDAGVALGIAFTGSLPAGMEDGSAVVIQGRFGPDGSFTADEVSIDSGK